MIGCNINVDVIAECNFTKKQILPQTFSNNSSKSDYQWNIIICKTSQNSFSETLYESSKISPFILFGTSARM